MRAQERRNAQYAEMDARFERAAAARRAEQLAQPQDVHVITVVNVHPEKDPSPSQLRRAKVVTVQHNDGSEAQSRALDAAPRSWPHKTIIRHTVNGVDV